MIDTQPIPATQHTPKKKRRWVVPTSTLVLGLALGSAAGAGSASNNTTVATPTPATTITQTVPVQTQDPELVAAARDAMAKAEVVAHLGGESLTIASDAFTAIANNDVATLTSKVDEMNALTPKIQAAVQDYNEAKARFESLVK